VQEHPDETAAQAKLDELVKLLNKYELQAYRRRAELHPDDAKTHFELGSILARTGAHDDAIPEFQLAARLGSDPAVKIKALVQMGESFEANGAPKLAERNYKEGLKVLDAEDKDSFLTLHYRLGRVSESLGNREAAEERLVETLAAAIAPPPRPRRPTRPSRASVERRLSDKRRRSEVKRMRRPDGS